VAAPAVNAATAPTQVASSTLRILNPPRLFPVFILCLSGGHAPSVDFLLPNARPKAVALSIRQSARRSTSIKTSAFPVNRGQFEAGNDQMLFSSIRARNRKQSLRLIRLACCDANMLRAARRKVVDLASCATEAEL
jgi:hypothetical protein